jgi:3D (Asp-Asp-Asp) domain-containing protein
MTVAVIAPYDDPDAASDLAVYRSQYGQPACPQTLSTSQPECLTVISESGALITPGSGTAPTVSASWELRASAQIDAVSATCPNCKILLVEVNSPAVADLGTGVNWAADLGAQVVTIGATQPETDNEATFDSAYFEHPGMAIIAAAGDGGFSTSGMNYPAASPYVTAVGGTTLTPAGTGTCTTVLAGTRGWCEQAWNDASGATTSACSLYETEPSWQKADLPAADTGCGSLRTVTDVSADADPATGIAVYDSSESGWQAAGSAGSGGTSVAAAIVAGTYALAGAPASGTYPASFPYAHPTGLNDIATGSNTNATNPTCSPAYLCTAGTGYDGPTGLGSPAFTTAFSGSGSFTGHIRSGVFSKCLDDSNGATTNAKVDIYTCNTDSDAQQWTVEANGTIEDQGHCLDNSHSGTTNGNLIDLYVCNQTGAQQWIPQSDGALLNPATGKCLDDPQSTTTNGTQLDLYTCNQTPAQDWTTPYPVPVSGPGEVTSGISGYCLDNYLGSSKSGNKVDIYTCNDGVPAQQWTIEADGTIQIQGLCLNNNESGTTSGSLINVYTCNDTGAQQWRALTNGELLNPETGLCLGDPGGSTTVGTQIELLTCDNGSEQHWTLP